MSDMSAHEFVQFVGAIGLTYSRLAVELRKSQPTISLYASGKQPIPMDVARQLKYLIDVRAKKLLHCQSMVKAHDEVVSALIIHNNEARFAAREPHVTAGRFMRRQNQPDTRTYPLYRLSLDRYKLFIAALTAWDTQVKALARMHTDTARQRDYTLELADLKAIAATAPRNAPYDICLQRSEWDVVSRALRHYGSITPEHYNPTAALRTHWSKYKAAGYPPHRGHTSEQPE